MFPTQNFKWLVINSLPKKLSISITPSNLKIGLEVPREPVLDILVLKIISALKGLLKLASKRLNNSSVCA